MLKQCFLPALSVVSEMIAIIGAMTNNHNVFIFFSLLAVGIILFMKLTDKI